MHKTLNFIKNMIRCDGGNYMAPVSVNVNRLTTAATSYINRRELSTPRIQGVLFSRDRAFQLDALLGSVAEKVKGLDKLTVIYYPSTEQHGSAYEQVFRRYADTVIPVRQGPGVDLKSLVIETLEKMPNEQVFFLVDDNFFIEDVDIQGFARLASPYSIPSLRMGENINYSYTLDCDQQKPNLTEFSVNFTAALRAWQWGCGVFDWGYPLSLDGHFFQRYEILAMTEAVDFDAPNHYEDQLQKFIELYQPRLGICFVKSVLLNLPFNRVQNDIPNRHGIVHQDDLLNLWNEGYELDRDAYYGVVNISAHQELPLKVRKRGRCDA